MRKGRSRFRFCSGRLYHERSGSFSGHELTPTLTGLERSVGAERKRPVDERIARLDEARAALSEGLDALDELRQDATRAKAEHANVVFALETTLGHVDKVDARLIA